MRNFAEKSLFPGKKRIAFCPGGRILQGSIVFCGKMAAGMVRPCSSGIG